MGAVGQHAQGLEVQLELVALERAPQPGGQSQPLPRVVELGDEHRRRLLAVLGPAHADHGVAQELGGRGPGFEQRDAHPCAQGELHPGHREGTAQRLVQALRGASGGGERLGGEALEDDEERGAAQPGHEPLAGHRVLEAGGDRAQELVAGGVAQGVVHEPQVSEVEAQHPE